MKQVIQTQLTTQTHARVEIVHSRDNWSQTRSSFSWIPASSSFQAGSASPAAHCPHRCPY